MQATIQWIMQELQGVYPDAEIRAFTRMIFHALRGWTLTDLLLREEERLSPAEVSQVGAIVSRLRQREPIQYILGEVTFVGLTLRVNPAVMIPRPETEELIHWIITSRNEAPLSLLDIGTGSGCIALALSKAFPHCDTRGCDLSEEALTVARNNALINHSGARFFKADILRWPAFREWQKTDLIVSNPPYVMESEKNEMEEHVVLHEPPLALYVPDEDPLLYYRHIAAFAHEWLSEEGELFLEINRRFGQEVTTLLSQHGFRKSEVRSDLSGNPRMVRAQK